MTTDAQRTALKRLHEHGGEGVIDQHGKVVANGVRLMGLDAITWLRLVMKGFVEVRGHLRLGITEKGLASLATEPGPKVNPHSIRGSNYQPPARLAGAE